VFGSRRSARWRVAWCWTGGPAHLARAAAADNVVSGRELESLSASRRRRASQGGLRMRSFAQGLRRPQGRRSARDLEEVQEVARFLITALVSYLPSPVAERGGGAGPAAGFVDHMRAQIATSASPPDPTRPCGPDRARDPDPRIGLATISAWRSRRHAHARCFFTVIGSSARMRSRAERRRRAPAPSAVQRACTCARAESAVRA